MTSRDSSAGRGVRLVPGGFSIEGRDVPLLAGAVHYFRLDPKSWRACLASVKAMGLRIVDVYIPWSVHELRAGELDVGGLDPAKDVAAFLRIAHELGLYVIARPGPHINAELTYFGIPERVIWDRACQARSPRDNPVMLPMLPFAFPVPSYASEAFHDEVARYFRLLGPTLAPLLYPEGPIVMVQVDNEGALYFRDGAYDQDYHPDAIALYRAFLRKKYGSLAAFEAAYGASPKPAEEGSADDLRFATVLPPTRFDAASREELARHLDWSEFHEHLLESAFDRFAKALVAAGIDGLPTSHNLPPGQDATPLNAARLTRAVDLVGLDYYHAANKESRAIIARRTSELSVRSEGSGVPAFACEMGAGYPPFFPPLEERDSMFSLLTALAYGLRGFNVYMAVERDRWIGAPIDPHGRPRPFAAFFERLSRALDETRFYTLTRRTPVRILTPRSERRLTRVMHAFGPITGAFFSVAGAGARERVSERDLGLGYPIGIQADSFTRTFEQSLEARGVPFAHVGGEDRDVSLAGAKWIVCASSGALNPGLYKRLGEEVARGAKVSFGPRAPAFDAAFRDLNEPFDLDLVRSAEVPILIEDDPAECDAAVGHAIEALGLPAYAADPDDVFVTVHEDALGQARVAFVIHPGDEDIVAKVTIAEDVREAVDALDDTRFVVEHGAMEIRLKPKSVRMLRLV